MKTSALILARDGDAAATTAALAAWTSIVARVDAEYAGAALDMVGAAVGLEVEVPQFALVRAVVQCGLLYRNTEPASGFSQFDAAGTNVTMMSEFHGGALRKSGAADTLKPWIRRRARIIK